MVDWQVNSESCPRFRFAFHLNQAAMILHDPINHRQSKASTFAALFRCEKRLKNVRLNFLADSAARVPDTNADIILGIGLAERFTHLWSRGHFSLQSEGSTCLHRIA